MTTAELLTHLRNLNVTLSGDNGQLILRGPKGALTAELRTELKERKAEILDFLKTTAHGTPSDLSLRCVSREKDLPLSFAQQRLWFLDQLEPGSAVYNVPGALRIKGSLDAEVLERCFNEIVRRHEALRTTFSTVEEEPVQVIAASANVSLPVIDLSRFSETEREDEARRLAREEADKPFDLRQGPLFRTALIRLGKYDHVLLLTLHHIVSDGWSMGVLYRELSALYQAFANEEPSPLADLPIQYADFAVWQRDWLRGEILENQLSYWKKQLGGIPAVLNFPTDRPRPARQSYRGARQSIELSSELTQGLKTLSRKEGVTLYMTLLAAFQILLHRYTGQDDIVVGSPIANRNRIEIEGLIGFFVNTLVLRTDHSANPTFREVLRRVRETALDAYAHQDLPFEKLVEELRPDRDLSRSPLFQAMFVFQNAPVGELNCKGLNVSPMRMAGETTKFDLTLSVNEGAPGLRAGLQYRTDLFDDATFTRFLGHFKILLEGIVANPEQRISDLPILSEAEKHQVLVEWNETKRNYPKDKCVHQLFEEQVKRTPEAVAVAFEDQQLTYRELNSQANQLAHYLKKLGVGPETLVGICVERSLEMIVGLLGVFKAGGAYVPLDPSYPKERLAFMLEDTEAAVLLTQERLIEKLPDHNATIRCLDRDWGEIAGESQDNPVPLTTADNLAYVIYTSGSTGIPKGALITHHNVVRLFCASDSWFHFSPDDVWTLFHSYAFDFSVWELWGALLHGGRLVIVSFEMSRSPQEFYELLCREQVTVLNQTPSAFRQLMQAEKSIVEHNRLGLRLVIFGGEALDFQSLKPWFDRHGDQRPQLINMYGITETTVHVTCRVIKESDLHAGMSSLIGVPIPDLELYVLDPYLNLVPVGVAGELYVGGAGVARGYLNRAELTAERFIVSPFRSGERLYKTGDLGRYLPNRDIEYLDRIDAQVKMRGYRIELGEIESVLSQHRSVSEAVVLAREEGPGDKQLVAYVVFNRDQVCTASELRSFLKGKLPDYMVPSAFVVLDSLPLTPNGKVDRIALPGPDQNRPALDETFTASRTPVEELLAQIWSDVLKLDKVGINDNFFDLGGHSLLATQIISRVTNSFQIDIQLRRLFETPTIAGLASSIEASLGIEKDSQRIPPIVPIPRSDEIPLSFAQQRLWFLDRIEPGNPTYNVPAAFRLAGELSVHALEQSLTEIARRHEVLRTIFSTVNGEPVQMILPPSHFSLAYTDLSDRPESEREQALPSMLSKEAERSFDLSRGPLIRAQLLRLASQDHVLFLNMHHIISDGWSMGVLFRELSELYQAYGLGKASPLPELAVQYADYSIWQRQWLQGEELDRQLSYWRKQLDGISPLQLPTDRVRPPVLSYQGSSQALDISVRLSEAIKSLSQRENVTLFMTLLAAFQLLLSRYCGQDNIAVGTPIAGRTRQEIERLIGFFVNTLVLRADLSANPTFTELLRQVRETTLDAYTHQDLPFEKLVEELHPERTPSYSPLFQVMFAFQNNADRPLKLEGLTIQPIRTASGVAKFDLTLTLSEKNGTLGGSLNYNTDLFDASTIERMLGHFRNLLEGIVANPEQRIGELPLLSEAEKHQLLVEWNDTKKDYPTNKCIHELFEEQVERTPDAIAVVFEEQRLTYRELNNRANQLGHHLRKLGVGPDVLVGICLERSLEMVIALLGVLKAGGAYVPLDPSYPKERLGFMIEDTPAGIVLTDRVSLKSLPPTRTRVICLNRNWEDIAKEPQFNSRSQSTADSLAYVIYTSGSTGVPKGVEVRHRGVVRLLFGVDYVQLDEAQTFLHLAPISFDAATFEIWGALLHGGKCVLFPGKLPSPRELGEVLKKQRINTLWLTAALFNTVINEEPQALSDVKQLLIGGEALSVPHVRKGLGQLPNTEIINGYGPTESTTFTCCYSIPRQLNGNLSSVPIGKPIGNTQVYVLDPQLNPVPIGVAGELHIGGDGLARGYLNHPELTAEKFIKDRFSTDPRARLYKTGDRARYLPDGNIEFLGRMDNQIKIRGFRIEPAEVSTVLNTHPAVRISHVMAQQQVSGDTGLTAYFVPIDSNSQSVKPSELRQFLSARLPNYMVPVSFIALAAIPLTLNGKVDSCALPDPRSQDIQETSEYVAPRDETELVLCRVWAEVLGLDRVGIDDDFFSLGGHSLLGAKLFTRLDEEFGRSYPLGILFTASTIRSLAENYRTSAKPKLCSVIIPLRKGGTLPPIYAVPGVFGNVVGFKQLAAELGSEQPFYGLQSVGLDGAQPPLDTIELMANLYLSEIRKIQARGPYALIGACFGATVAYEMTRQFLESGEEVAFLGLLDPTRREGNNRNGAHTYAPQLVKRAIALGSLLTDRLRLYQEEMRRLSIKDRLKYLSHKLHVLGGSLGINNGFKGFERELHQVEVYRANIRALDCYYRKPLHGRLKALEIFETARLSNSRVSEKLDWNVLWKGQTIRHLTPGRDSGDMMSGKNAHVLAALLAERLREAFGRSRELSDTLKTGPDL